MGTPGLSLDGPTENRPEQRYGNGKDTLARSRNSTRTHVGGRCPYNPAHDRGAQMSYTETQAEEHGLKAGRRIVVLTIQRRDGTIHRSLYLYDTAAHFAMDGLDRDGISYTKSHEPWDGSERISFYNGD